MTTRLFGPEGDMESELPVEGKRTRLVRDPDADVVYLLDLQRALESRPSRGSQILLP